MRIHRSEHPTHFVILPNALAQSTELGLVARGLLTDLLSRRDGHPETARDIAKRCRIGRGSLQKAFGELIAAGYYWIEKVRRPDGTIVSVAHVYDTPRATPARQALALPPAAGEPASGRPGALPKNQGKEPSLPAPRAARRRPAEGWTTGADGTAFAPTRQNRDAEPPTVLSVAPPTALGTEPPAALGVAPPAALGTELGPQPPAVGVAPAAALGAEPPAALSVAPPTALGAELGPQPPAVGVTPPAALGPEPPAALDAGTLATADTLMRVLRPEPRLRLTRDEAGRLAPLVTQWLELGSTTADLAQALIPGLPAVVHCAEAMVRNRLERKKPPVAVTVQAPKPRYSECTECHDPVPTPGICRPCAGLPTVARSVPVTATAGPSRARQAFEAARAALVRPATTPALC